MKPKKSAKKKTKNKSNGKSSKNLVTSSVQVITKKRKKKCKENQYSSETLVQALDSIGKGCTIREAAYRHGIPKTTLHAKLKNHSPVNCKKGPQTVLSATEKQDIVDWILYSAEKGFPVTKSHLLDCIQKYLNDTKQKTILKNNRPGKHWYTSFMSRHPQLSQRIAQNLTMTRASVSEEDLRSWFDYIKKHLEAKNLLNIEPCRIFNLDESAFAMVPKDNCVLTKKGSKSVYQIVSSSEKTTLTVLFIASADGTILPPLILFDCKITPRKQTLSNIPKGWAVGHTDSGWMQSETFYHFIQNVFLRWLQENKIEFPVILFVDGHVSHLSLPLMKLCQENKIELIALYPNATHIIQPLDVALFHPLKDAYRNTLRKWKLENNIVDFKKNMFAPVLELTLINTDFSSTIQNGFKACGLYPFDPNAVNYNILNKNKKDENCTNEETVNSCESEDALVFFEKNVISESVLNSFKICRQQGKWTGDPAYKAQFELWIILSKKSHGKITYCF